MESFFCEHEDLSSLGIVFFANNFIRALDEFKISKKRPNNLSHLCDKAISSLDNLPLEENSDTLPISGLFENADEIASLAVVIKKQFNIKSFREASKAIETIKNTIIQIKDQKTFTSELQKKIDHVIVFFEGLAVEGLSNSKRIATGEASGAERIWQHYAMS